MLELDSEVRTNVGVAPFSMTGSTAAMGDIILTEYGVGEDWNRSVINTSN